MINFNSTTNTFHLQGKNISYIFAVDNHGFLRHLHFGEKLSLTDNVLHLGQTSFLGAAVNFDGAQMPNDNLNATMLEYSFEQMGDYRSPMVVVELANGSRLTDFRYVGYELLENYALPNMPHARGGETLKVILRCKEDLELHLFYTIFDDCDVVVRSCTLVNTGAFPVNICKLASFSLDFYDADFDTIQLVGNWASERRVVRQSAHNGILEITSGGRGESSHCHNPFLALVSHNATENDGTAVGVNLIYSGDFSLICENSSLHSTRVQGGINSNTFRWLLQPNQSFCAPQAVLTFAQGIGGMSRALHNFMRNHLMNPAFAHASRPVVVNNWEATYFNFDSQKLQEIICCAKDLGIDTFVLDDGWFTNRDNDTNGLGDWEENTQKLQGGLKAISDCCHQNGLKFGLWFEPEMVNEGTKLFAEHPEWVLCAPNNGRTRGRHQLVLDFTNDDVVDCIFEKMRTIIAQNNVDYVKWDMNRYLADLYSTKLPKERQGEVSHRYVLGVYRLAQKLIDAFPKLFVEGCSGGGGRFDAGMLFYFPQIWTSDNTDAYCRTFIQYGTSICYPPSSMSAHFSVCPNHQTGRSISFDARYNVASTCAFGYELDITRLTDDEKQQVRTQVENYRKDEMLVINGDLYRLQNPSTDNLWAVCQVNAEKTKARVVGLHGLILENNRAKLLRIDGLDDNFDYLVVELNTVLSGKALRTAGVLLPQTFADFATFALHLEKQ